MQVAAAGWWSRLSAWQAPTHVVRPERGAACVEWHVAHVWCDADACNAGSPAGLWQLTHAGAAETPAGPCAR